MPVILPRLKTTFRAPAVFFLRVPRVSGVKTEPLLEEGGWRLVRSLALPWMAESIFLRQGDAPAEPQHVCAWPEPRPTKSGG